VPLVLARPEDYPSDRAVHHGPAQALRAAGAGVLQAPTLRRPSGLSARRARASMSRCCMLESTLIVPNGLVAHRYFATSVLSARRDKIGKKDCPL